VKSLGRNLLSVFQAFKTLLDFKDLYGFHLADDPISKTDRRAFVTPIGLTRFMNPAFSDSLADATRWLSLHVSVEEEGQLRLDRPDIVPCMYERV